MQLGGSKSVSTVHSLHFQEPEGKELNEDLHEHGHHELCFVWRGSGDCQVGAANVRFSAGTLLQIPPRTLHCWRGDAGSEGVAGVAAIVLHFHSRLLPSGLIRLPEMAGLKSLAEALRNPLRFTVADRERLRARLRSIDRAQGVLKYARFLAALELLASYERSEVSESQGPTSKLTARDIARLERVKRLVEQRFRTSIQREEAAQALGLDDASFSRFFKRAMGTGFVDYVANFRVRQAALLLGNRRDVSLAEVATRSGFGSLASMHRQFRKRLGTTPDRYRKAANAEIQAP